MNAELIVSMLEGVKARGPNQWSARCPAHEDRGPSLSVKGMADGRVLLHCFAGCDVQRVLDVLGLDMQALFPLKQGPGSGHSAEKRPRLMSKGQALEMLAAEALFVAVAAGNAARGVMLNAADTARLMTAAGRIAFIRQEAAS